MSVLKQKLDKAAQKFQTHCFRQALEAYEDCLSFCYKTDQSKQMIFNIMSVKGALQCILGQHQKAMTTLNQILKHQPNHYLALIRRSQVYKKRSKLNRAFKDIETISAFCPDNLQLVAMKIQIENLRSKTKNVNSSEESDSQDLVDEQVALNFSTLKKIDRKSCSITLPESRKSRVTISGDTAFEYELNEEANCDKSNSTAFSKENIKQKYQRTFNQIQGDDQNQGSNKNLSKVVNIVVKATGRSKSILKNRGASIAVNQPKVKTQPQQKYGGRQSKLVEKLMNIDGKVIASGQSISNGSQKQVQFRKSIHFGANIQIESITSPPVEKSKHRPTARKSCLKRGSFDKIEQQVKKLSEKPIRKSKFQMLSRNSIDGRVLKSQHPLQTLKAENEQSDESNSDEGEHNIFGNVVLPKQITDRFGLQQEKKVVKQKYTKGRSTGGKSILKKNSVLLGSSQKKVSLQPQIKQQPGKAQIVKKAKKSVMFTKSRFAD